MTPRSLYLSVEGHELHLLQWGEDHQPAIVMWHGLARTGRDFDLAAAHFAAQGFRVICPDTIGRGLSCWSSAPERDYTFPVYAAHALGMLDRLGIDSCHWVGTSMGGALGMVMAAGPLEGRITRLVMNDIGPTLNPAAVERIKAYVTFVPDFGTMAEFEAFIRAVYKPYGEMTDAQWRQMAETSHRRRGDGRITVHYDPQVMHVFAAHAEAFELWEAYDGITCPTLVLRGAESDLLLPEVAAEMTQRGPMARLVTVPGCGHAPALNTPAQLAVLETFLLG